MTLQCYVESVLRAVVRDNLARKVDGVGDDEVEDEGVDEDDVGVVNDNADDEVCSSFVGVVVDFERRNSDEKPDDFFGGTSDTARISLSLSSINARIGAAVTTTTLPPAVFDDVEDRGDNEIAGLGDCGNAAGVLTVR